ncbi:hypothetical protein VU04_00145 [Desulfobulbus sp. TB]|nr:hypothetical protein [Desulfobulbus sp. TB]
MGIQSDLWSSSYEDNSIDIELYVSGITTAGASLFINSKRVDSVPCFSLLGCDLSLRHNIENNVAIHIQIKQRLWGSKAFLSINGQSFTLDKKW